MSAGLGAMARTGGRLVVRREALLVLLLGAVFFVANGGLFRLGGVNGLVWLGLTACAAGVALRQPRRILAFCGARWTVFVVPLFLLLTAVWSHAPAVTLVSASKMILTVLICCVLAANLSSRAVVRALLWSMAFAMGMSLLNLMFGLFAPVYEVNGAFLGIFPQKTQVARTAVWLGFALVAWSAYRGWPLVLGVAGALALVPVTLIAQSMTGVIGFVFVGLLAVGLAVMRLPGSLRLALPVLALCGTGAVLVVYAATGGAPLAEALAVAGKSETLTGRTVLWGIGMSLWSDSPLVGIGYGSFWEGAAYAAERTFIEAHVDEGLNGFHNGYVELLVASGVVGAGLFAGVVIRAVGRLVRCAVVDRSLDAVIWAVALAALMVMALVETSLFAARSLNLVLLTFALIEADRRRCGSTPVAPGVR